MGCISSKILTKSLSFREDLSHRSKRNRIANGIPMPDELFPSDNGTSGDHKSIPLVLEPQTGSFDSPPISALEPTNVEMINTWELMAGLEEQVEQKQEVETKSSMILRAEELVSSKIADVGKITRSKSCHWSLENEGLMIDLAFEGLNKDHFDYVTPKSLQIPSAAELQSIGSLKEWLLGGGGGCVESPGDYVTPKSGNYDQSWSEFGEEWKEESILNPELLAAFDEFIQQLELEEERILTKIEGNTDKINGKAEENKEHSLNGRNRPQFIL